MKIHTIQLNIEDFEAGTQYMDAREKGAYISLLICLYKSSDNSIPDDDERLSRMAGVTRAQWRKIRPILEQKFIVLDRHWKHKRVLKEAERYRTLSKKNKSNALKNNNSPEPVASQSHSQTQANTNNKELRTSNKKEPPIIPQGGRAIILPEFIDDLVWQDFKKHRGSKFTKLAQTRIINQLEKWHGEGYDPNEILNRSIMNGWSGVFEPDNKKGNTNGKYTASDALGEVLTEIRADSDNGGAMLCSTEHLRQDTRAIENINAGDDTRLARIPIGRD